MDSGPRREPSSIRAANHPGWPLSLRRRVSPRVARPPRAMNGRCWRALLAVLVMCVGAGGLAAQTATSGGGSTTEEYRSQLPLGPVTGDAGTHRQLILSATSYRMTAGDRWSVSRSGTAAPPCRCAPHRTPTADLRGSPSRPATPTRCDARTIYSPGPPSRPGSACRTRPPARRHAAPPADATLPAVREPLWGGGVVRRHARPPLHRVQLCHHAVVHGARRSEVAAAEVEPHHRMAYRPIPTVMNVQPGEQFLVALEQLLERGQEQTLPEPPRTRQEVVHAFFLQPPEARRLVHVVAVLLPQLAERLYAYRQPPPAHRGPILSAPPPTTQTIPSIQVRRRRHTGCRSLRFPSTVQAGWHKTQEAAWVAGGMVVKGYWDHVIVLPERGRPPDSF